MKNVSKKNKKFSLIKLFLLKYRIFKNFTCIKKVNITVSYIKQALLVISSYHRNIKKILFVGLSNNNNITAVTHLKTTNHSFIPQGGWSKKSFGVKVPDLIVICNSNLKEVTSIGCIAIKSNVPVITFQDLNIRKVLSYRSNNASGDYQNKKLKKFIFFLIFSIIKNTGYKK